MNFFNQGADTYIRSDFESPHAALHAVTHLCIAAHQDDIEIMAQSGISDCLDIKGKAFGGVVVTNGAGSPRTGAFAEYTDLQMQDVRKVEQRKAALLGNYAIQVQLAHPSSDVKSPQHQGVKSDLIEILAGCRPEILFLHNPADKHDTHIAVLLRTLEALRCLPENRRPERVLGCEVWRDLDWLPDSRKVAMDSGRHPELARKLLEVFDSQISGGKRYDHAAIGRRLANATFHTSHSTDRFAGISWAIDLTPVTRDQGPSLEEYTSALIDEFRADVALRLNTWS